ncbi:MAG: 30S ribosomal protein S5 [Candidatus Iainarchaeum archaeon]|uniref:Small ribosomal subunit protein uS5 n=1 Tax=Candidatus Iainarchaeum sp. TaxID=3101447 RepID=A0A7T9I1F6_9ARCH|nr:MAG: 30S ribosomal protein S5 [Candidatus Diapherotrites archaeon]
MAIGFSRDKAPTGRPGGGRPGGRMGGGRPGKKPNSGRGSGRPGRQARGAGARNARRELPRKELMTEEQLKDLAAQASGVGEKVTRESSQLEAWTPRTTAGKLVKAGEITKMEDVWGRHLPVLEPEIIDTLVPNLDEKVIDTRKTTYVRASGRRFNYSAFVLVGDRQNYIGFGMGSDKERYPAIRKAVRNAKLHLIPVRSGAGSWQDFSDTTRSVPFKVTGKSSSVRVTLHPAPKGTGLVVGKHIVDVFQFAGITDVWAQTRGSSDTKLNFVRAAYNALEELNKVKMSPDMERKFSRKATGSVN